MFKNRNYVQNYIKIYTKRKILRAKNLINSMIKNKAKLPSLKLKNLFNSSKNALKAQKTRKA